MGRPRTDLVGKTYRQTNVPLDNDWLAVLGPASREEKAAVFTCQEDNLNRYAGDHGELSLTIPMVYVEAEKAVSE